MFSLSVLALLGLRSVALVNAALFILDPFQGTTCLGGQPCTVSWEDDGEEPLLPAIGVSTVALYTSNQHLIQTLPPVNVETTSHFTFTPLPSEGPNSNNYYITFTSTQFNVSEGIPYRGYSAFFRLSGMSGSFKSPLPAATSSISIPQSIENPSTSSRISTITVGTLSLSPTPSVTSVTTSVSRFSSSIIPITSVSRSTTSSPSSSSASAPAKSNGGSSHLPGPLPVLFLVLFSFAFFFS